MPGMNAVGDEGPNEPGGQEAVVQALIGGKSPGRFGEFGRRTERAPSDRVRPQKHLEDQEINVEGRHHDHEHGRNQLHGVTLDGRVHVARAMGRFVN